jgi:hypothetical protein
MRERERESEREQSRSREYTLGAAAVSALPRTRRGSQAKEHFYIAAGESSGTLVRASGLRAREGAAELRGDVARLLERSGCEADVRGQRRGPPAHRVAHAGFGFPSPPILSHSPSRLNIYISASKKTLKNGGRTALLFYLSTTCLSYKHRTLACSVVRSLVRCSLQFSRVVVNVDVATGVGIK